MRTLLILLFLAASASAQTLPDVKWELAAWPSIFPDGDPQTQDVSGEDWFYSVDVSRDASGAADGLIGAGYSSARNVAANSSSTFRDVLPSQAPLDRCRDSKGGSSIAKVGLDGEVQWYRYDGREGSYWKVISTSDGGYVATGYTKDWRGLVYNPGAGMSPTLDCPADDRARTATVTKFSADGTLLWEYAYGLLSDPTQFTVNASDDPAPAPGPNARHFGNDRFWDLVEMPDGSIRLVGCLIENAEGNSRAAVVDISSTGQVLAMRAYGDPGKRSMFMGVARQGNRYAVTGAQFDGPRNTQAYGRGPAPYGDVIVNVLTDAPAPLPLHTANLTSSSQIHDMGYDVAFAGNAIHVATVVDCTYQESRVPVEKQCFRYGASGEGEAVVYRLSQTLLPLSQTSLGDVKAFDLMVGLTETSDGGVAAVSTRQTTYNPPGSEDYLDDTDTYVTKMTGAGTIEWAFTYDAKTTRPQLLRDSEGGGQRLKNQECLYQIVELPGGDLVVAGNNSSNLDDSYLVRFGPSSTQTVPAMTVENSHLAYSATGDLTVGPGVDVEASPTQTARLSLLAGASVVWAGSFTAAAGATLVARTEAGYGSVTPAASGLSSAAPPPMASARSGVYEFELSGAYPNPSSGLVQVAYGSDGEGAVALRLYDALGREVLYRRHDSPTPGLSEFQLDGSALAPGVYVYRLTSGDRHLSGTLSIAR